MKMSPAQLPVYLQKNSIPPVYLVTGDEPLQHTECADAIRANARAKGFHDRTVLAVDANFSWAALAQETSTLSLFAARRWIELRLDDKSPGTAGNDALARYLAQPSADLMLLITAGRLSTAEQKSKWFKAVEESGVVIPCNALSPADFPAWIGQRLQNAGLRATPEAVALLAERAEGHLAACAQEIEKLRLLWPDSTVTPEQIIDAVADSARFEIFGWIDTVLAGTPERIVRQLWRLREEGVEPVPILVLLTREIHALCQFSAEIRQGEPFAKLAGKYRFWGARQALARKALQRHSMEQWQILLQYTVFLDKLCKGASSGNVWDALQRLALRIAGIRLAATQRRPTQTCAIPLH